MIKSKIPQISIIIAIFICISSCTATNIHSNSNLENISSVEQARLQIRNGMSMSEVQNKWGDPNEKLTSNNETFWSYVHKVVSMSLIPGVIPHKTKTVQIMFVNGIVSSVGYSEEQKNY